MTSRRQHGFTLVELLVALLVFSFLAAAGVYSLRLAVEAREQLSEADKRIAELETARILIREDMLQIALRPVRDEYGAVFGPPFQGGEEVQRIRMDEGERLLLAFVRGGWRNPDSAEPRSSLQFVEYVGKNGALVRRVRPYLDGARGQPSFDRVLISDAANVEITFLTGEIRGELEWAPGWPQQRAGSAPPLAIALTYEPERYGRIEQYFWIGELSAERGGEGS